jgi:hypothetical protein
MGGYQHPPTARGYQVYEVVSALQKAIRRSNPEEAVYWAMEMHKSGHDAWLWKRLREITAEDIGPAERDLPAQIDVLQRWCKERKGAGTMAMVQAVILLATAKKSGIACFMAMRAGSDHHERLEIPDHALDQHTRRGKAMGRGKTHFVEEGQKKIDPLDAAREHGYADVQTWLNALEQDSIDHWLQKAKNPAELPNNPVRKDDETWVPPANRTSEQTSLLGEDES